MASRGATLRGALAIPGGARPTPAPQGSAANYNGGRGLNAPSIGQVSPLAAQLANEGGYARIYGGFLPRPPRDFTQGAFGPFSPILPVPVDEPPPGAERPEARRYDYQVGWNLPTGQPGQEGLKLASFQTLQSLADGYSVARACVEYRKNQIRGIDWDITPTPEAAKTYQGSPAKMADFGKRRAKAVKFFMRPDRNYYSYATWLSALLEEVLVFDALSLLIRPVRGKGRGKGVLGSDLDSLMLVNGPTVRPLIDLHGGSPLPPAPGYQQYLKGVPRSDYMRMIFADDLAEAGLTGQWDAQFSGDQLIYMPMIPRTWTPYGLPPIERALIPIYTGLQKQGYQYDFFSESTVPASYIIPGDTALTPNQLRELQDALNAIAGDPAFKQKIIVLPPGSHVEPQKPISTADELDHWLANEVTMAFGMTPMELGITAGRSSSSSGGAQNQMAKMTQDRGEDTGLTPFLKYLADIFNLILQEVCGQEDMQFTFEGLQQEEDQDAMTGVLVQQFQNGMRTLDECRQELNLQPYGLEETSEPLLVTPTGVMPISTAVQNATTAAAQAQAQLGVTQAQATEMQQAAAAGTAPDDQNPNAPQGQQQPRTASASGTAGGKPSSPAPTAAAGAEGKREAASAGNRPQRNIVAGASRSAAANSAANAPTRAAAAAANREAASAKKQHSSPVLDKRAAAELSALARHLCKGRPVSTWDARFISQSVLSDVAKGLAEGLHPEQAVKLAQVRATVQLPASEYEWVEKVGPKGYVHGWICVRPPCGDVGDEVHHPDHGKGTITSAGKDGLHAHFEDGTEAQLGHEAERKESPKDIINDLAKKHPFTGSGQELIYDDPAVKALASEFNGSFGGFSVKNARGRYSVAGKRIVVSGKITDDKTGEEAGNFTRVFKTDGSVEHKSMELEPQYQGQGFATAFNKHLEDNVYKPRGISQIRLEADLDVGAYAWARRGYDWADPDEARAMLDHFRSLNANPENEAALDDLEERMDAAEEDPYENEFPTPYEFSIVGYQAGASSWLGKEAMLDYGGQTKGWQAVKYL